MAATFSTFIGAVVFGAGAALGWAITMGVIGMLKGQR